MGELATKTAAVVGRADGMECAVNKVVTAAACVAQTLGGCEQLAGKHWHYQLGMSDVVTVRGYDQKSSEHQQQTTGYFEQLGTANAAMLEKNCVTAVEYQRAYSDQTLPLTSAENHLTMAAK